MVTRPGVFPSSPPRPVHTLIFMVHRFQHSHLSAFYAHRLDYNFANSPPRAFGLSICHILIVLCEVRTHDLDIELLRGLLLDRQGCRVAHPFHILSSRFFFFFPLPRRSPDLGSLSRFPPPFPATVLAFIFIARRIPAISSLMDSHRIAPLPTLQGALGS